ncbi:DsrE family protein [Hwanghaeella grinnelliae]|nr:DsrE family protein [Hwanghaeella grinnelliae]
MKMKNQFIIAIAVAMAVIFGAASQSSAAEDPNAGLFVNLTSGDTGMAGHALVFAGKALKRGHPVVLFLNHKAVLIAAEGVPQTSYQGMTLTDHLTALITDGAKVIVCQMCMKMHGMTEAHLIDGAVRGEPDLVQGYFFDPIYKVMSW